MSKVKAIALSSTPNCHDHDTYVVTIGDEVNSVWDDLEQAQDVVEELDGLGNKDVMLRMVKRNVRYPSPKERSRSVVMVGRGTYMDSEGVIHESQVGSVGTTEQND